MNDLLTLISGMFLGFILGIALASHVRHKKKITLPLIAVLLCPVLANATTYYVCAATGSPCNAADTNAGTSKTATWLHAPGMPNCTGTCASTTPAAGDSLIFRGGDTWDTSNSSASDGTAHVYTGTGTSCSGDGPNCSWHWTFSGTATNCNPPATTSSCIYIGVDATWFSGASFKRPIWNLDNPTWANSTHQDGSHSGYITACTFDDVTFIGWDLHANYVIVDNWEMTGLCVGSAGGNGGVSEDSHLYSNFQTNTVEHCYFHGWTEIFANQVNSTDWASMVSGPLLNLSYNVMDGTDAGPACNADQTCTGNAELSNVTNIDHNVFRKIAGGPGAQYLSTLHDNLFEFMYDSSDTVRHTDVAFTFGNNAPANSTLSVYNNIVRHVIEGQTFALDPPSGGTIDMFNNTFFDIGNSGNCIVFQGTNTTAATINFVNNTIDASCTMDVVHSNNLALLHGALNFRNNHMIGSYTSMANFYTAGNASLTITDNGNEIFQTEAVANGQGYVQSNNYQPTAITNATYHAGANRSADCSAYSSDSALCNGSTGGVTSTAGSGNIPVLYIASPAARNTTWDVGAYQFQASGGGGGTTGAPAPWLLSRR